MHLTRRAVMIGPASLAAAIVLGVVAFLLLGRSSPARLGRSSPARPSDTPRTSAPAARQMRSPFTGEPVKALRRVLAVEIDNIVLARPQTGLPRADIVYRIPLDGGPSRFL